MRIAVCVATKNRTDLLHQFLWSLIRQEHKDWDLTIVDDSDAPVQWNGLGVYPRLFNEITRTDHDIRIVQGPRVSCIGAAYQAGFHTSKQDNPLFFRADDDSWLEPNYFSYLVEVMHDQDVGACGGLFLHPGQEIETFSDNDPRYKHVTIEHLSDQTNVQWFKHSNLDRIPVEHLTANILFSRNWLQKIGGFESRLYHQHRDETQVTWRLHVEGAKLYVDPHAVAWHLKGMTGGARGHSPNVYLEDHRRFMAQRKTMRPGIHLSLGHAIGDGFMATPMLATLRHLNPNRNIAIYAPWARDVLTGNPDVDEIASHPLDAQRTVRIEESVYTWASANRWQGHLTEAYCKMLNLPTPKDCTPRFFWIPDESTHSLPEELNEQPYIVIAPWSSAKTFDFFGPSGNKNWPLDRWSEVVQWAQDAGFVVVQLRGSTEEPLVDGVDVDLCGKPLREALAYIEKARLVVSVDTMAHHAAAAFGVPSVVLWGRSKVDHFGYKKSNIINIQGKCPGITTQTKTDKAYANQSSNTPVKKERPCIDGDQWAMDKVSCPIEGHPCMNEISTDTVLGAMKTLLKHDSTA
jgi:ADP-heptose:LPS heptosyltransferase